MLRLSTLPFLAFDKSVFEDSTTSCKSDRIVHRFGFQAASLFNDTPLELCDGCAFSFCRLSLKPFSTSDETMTVGFVSLGQNGKLALMLLIRCLIRDYLLSLVSWLKGVAFRLVSSWIFKFSIFLKDAVCWAGEESLFEFWSSQFSFGFSLFFLATTSFS